MPTAAYSTIATTTLTSVTNQVSFTSIPSTYTDLVGVLVLPSVSSGGACPQIAFNTDSGGNYNVLDLYAYLNTVSGYVAGSAEKAISSLVYSGSGVSGTVSVFEVMNYTSTVWRKGVLFRSGDIDTNQDMGYGVWNSTSVITSVQLGFGVNGTGGLRNMGVGTTATLYGITRA